jgi:nitroreductase
MSNTTATEVLTVTEAAEARRSIRKYEPTPIPRAHLEEIIRVTSLAPSPWNLQPWRFVIVEDAAVKAQLQAAAYGQPQVGAAPAVIVMYSDMTDAINTVEETIHPGMKGPQGDKAAADIRATFAGFADADRAAWGNAESNIALGYLLLAAQAHGYSTSPMLGFMPDKVKELLGLPADARVPALIAIGKGAEEGFPHHRHPLARITRFV